MNTKNISLLGLGLFAAVALASCDKIEESLSTPITNPQLPIFESSTVVYTPESAINASNPAAGEAKVATCSATDLPEGFTIGGLLQLSNDADFSTVIESPLVNKDNVLYADLSTLAAQYAENYTKVPDAVSLYGRTILTASNAAGTESVRLGSAETYYGVQSYSFTPAAPDHLIAESYYLVMGAPDNWDFANAIECNHAGSNQYDDPLFSVSISSLSANGNNWIILAKDDYENAKGASSLAGVDYLVPVYDYEENGTQHGDLEFSSKSGATAGPELTGPSMISFNMEKLQYSLEKQATSIYIIGAPAKNGWNINGDALRMSETSGGSNIFKGVLYIGEGQFMFRFYSKLGDWETHSIGSQNDDKNLSITFDGDTYEGDVFQGGVNCTLGKGNWTVDGWAGGAVEITLDLNTLKVQFKKIPVESGIYLRGGMVEGWAVDPAYEFAVSDVVNVWTIANVKLDAGVEFKVADADWGAINLGAGSVSTIMPGEEFPLDGGSNIVLGAAFDGSVSLSYVEGAYTLTLTPKE